MTKGILYPSIFICSVLIASISQVLLKKSAVKQYKNMLSEYLNPAVFIAYVMFFSSTVVNVFAYKGINLTLGPVLESFGYVFVTVLSALFLREKPTKKRLFSLLIILFGIAVFSYGIMQT